MFISGDEERMNMEVDLEKLARLVGAAGGKKAVAERARITRNTLDRAMKGEPVRARNLDNIARALGTTVADLGDDKIGAGRSSVERGAPQRIWWTTYPVPHMNLHLVARRYGVEPRTILEAAPILFTILAEDSLHSRRRLVEALNSSLQGVMGAKLSDRLPNVRYGAFRAQNALWREEASIAARDLDGRMDDDEEPGDGSSPFVDFLQSRLIELGIDSSDGEGADTDFYIRVTTLFEEEFLAITTGDERAAFALWYRHTSIRDIPQELGWTEDEDAERGFARRDWLAGKVPDEAWERHQQELRDIFDDKEIN
jgi:transcriptional regulator with XRE-family HTH domain